MQRIHFHKIRTYFFVCLESAMGQTNSLFPMSAVCTDDADFVAGAQHLSELEAALRTRLFKHELALGNAARAHALVLSNPDKARSALPLEKYTYSRLNVIRFSSWNN